MQRPTRALGWGVAGERRATARGAAAPGRRLIIWRLRPTRHRWRATCACAAAMAPTLPNARSIEARPPAPRTSRPQHPQRPSRAALVAAAVGGVSALVGAGLARSGRGPTHPLDRHVRRSFLAAWRDRVPRTAWWSGGRHTRRHALNEALGGLAGQWLTLAGGAAAAAAVARRAGVRPALPVLATVPLGLGAHAALKYAIRRPRPMTARLTGKHTPSFPSGHAARGVAAAGIIGYVAVREGVMPTGVALPLATGIALAGGASRVYVDRHWATDAIGGWGLGLAAAALCALWYDHLRPAGA